MTGEIYWLTLTTLFSSLLFIPYAYVRISKIGFVRLLVSPLPGDDPFEKEWAHRAYRAHMNAVENIVIFAPLVLAVQLTGLNNEVTLQACMVYFWARVIHAPFYIFNTPFVRTIAYFVGLGACLVLAYQLLAQSAY
ncbi:MAG: MAPEG family protein [Gammaproteobacteria bacterium]|nr:MAPEG family protein [Gammaproteobacteria bacterium]